MQQTIHSTVLIVEDDGRLRSILERSLHGNGFRVHSVRTLAEAKTIVRLRPMDVIVVDLGLPDGSGWDVIRCSRSLDFRAPKVVVMTATHQALPPDPALVPDVLLRKPFAIVELIRHLKTAEMSANATTSTHGGPLA